MDYEKFLNEVVVLYVEDDLIVKQEVGRFLARRCKEVHEAENGLEGLELYNKINPHIVVTDIEMPEMSGLEMIDKIMESRKKIPPVIVTTAYDDEEHRHKNVCVTIIKPFITKELLHSMIKCLERERILNDI